MKKLLITLIYVLLSGAFCQASVEEGRKEIKPPLPRERISYVYSPNVAFVENEREKGLLPEIQPLRLNRSVSSLRKMFSLPEDFQVSLRQFFLETEPRSAWVLSAKGVEIQSKGRSNKSQKTELRLQKFLETLPLVDNTYVSMVHTQGRKEDETALSFGAKGSGSLFSMKWNADLSYEEMIAAEVTSSGLIAGVSSIVEMPNIIPTELQLNWQYAAERAISDELKYLYADQEKGGEIFNPAISNISILNVCLACNPSKNMYMSVDYYHYLQDQVQIQSISNNSSLLPTPEYTSGESRNLGQEWSFTATFAHNKNFVSQLFAGWFDPGTAYSKVDDNKTFEIRGEIIVNF